VRVWMRLGVQDKAVTSMGHLAYGQEAALRADGQPRAAVPTQIKQTTGTTQNLSNRRCVWRCSRRGILLPLLRLCLFGP
jgi:hypothetical protein